MMAGSLSSWEDVGMVVFVETERLLLRQFKLRDADLLLELDSDPRVMRYISGGAPHCGLGKGVRN